MPDRVVAAGHPAPFGQLLAELHGLVAQLLAPADSLAERIGKESDPTATGGLEVRFVKAC